MAYSITEAMVGWLSSMGFDAHTSVPASRPDEFATCEPGGGTVSDMVPSTLMAVQFWALSDARAEEMAMSARNAMLEGARPAGVFAVDVNSGPYPFPDPDSRQRRWQLLVDVTHRL